MQTTMILQLQRMMVLVLSQMYGDLAVNYNPSATTDNGTCVVMSGGCGDATALNYSGDSCSTANFIANDCQFELPELWPNGLHNYRCKHDRSGGADVIFMNNDTPAPLGSLLGAGYTNDSRNLLMQVMQLLTEKRSMQLLLGLQSQV